MSTPALQFKKGEPCVWKHTGSHKIISDLSRFSEGLVGVDNARINRNYPVIWLRVEALMPVGYREPKAPAIQRAPSRFAAEQRKATLLRLDHDPKEVASEDDDEETPTVVGAPRAVVQRFRPAAQPIARAVCSRVPSQRRA